MANLLTTFRERILSGAKAFRYPSGNRTGTSLSGSLAGLWGLGLQPPSRYNFRTEAGSPIDNGVVRTGVKWLCRAWTEAPQVVYRPDGAGELQKVPGHPLLDLLARPSRFYSGARLWAGTLLSWVIDGNAYWYVERNGMGQVVGLIYIPHFQIGPYGDPTGKELIGGYVYRVDGVDYPLAVEDVIHFANGVDPMNTRRGLSDLGAELRSICTDNESQSYAASLLRNFGVPGVVISPKGETVISPEAATQLKAMWRERFTGDSRGDPLASPLPIEVTNPGFSPEQLALDKLASLGTPRICAAMGLDPLMLGLPSESKTYDNLREAKEAAYENTLIPLQQIMDDAITCYLMPIVKGAREEDRLGRDYTQVRSLAPDMDAQYKRQAEAVGGPYMTPNESRSLLGLPPIAGGDVLYPPRSAGGFGGGEEGGKPPQDGDKALKDRLSAKWRDRRIEAERGA